MEEVLPPVLDSTSDQPPLFDGTTRFFNFHSVFFSDHVLIPCLVGNKLKSCKRKEHKENSVVSMVGKQNDRLNYPL